MLGIALSYDQRAGRALDVSKSVHPALQIEVLPGEVEGVHEAQAACSGETTGGDVDGKELGEVLLGAGLFFL